MSATLARGSFYEVLANEARVARCPLPSARFVRLKSKAAERVLMLTTFNGQTACMVQLFHPISSEGCSV